MCEKYSGLIAPFLGFSETLGRWFIRISTREEGAFGLTVTSNFFGSLDFPDGHWTDRSFVIPVGDFTIMNGQVFF